MAFELLCAYTRIAQLGMIAGWAFGGWPLLAIADMAFEATNVRMEYKGSVTVSAVYGRATILAV